MTVIGQRPQNRRPAPSVEVGQSAEWVSKEIGYDADRPEEGLTFKFFAIPKNSP